MPVLRDVSFLWAMFHMVVFNILLLEPRYSWRRTILWTAAGSVATFTANALLIAWKGPGIIMLAAFFTCILPSLLLLYFLSLYRDGRLFFLFCLTDTLGFWLLQVTNFLDRLAGGGYVVLLVTRLILFPLAEYLFWRYLRRPFLSLQREMQRGWWLFAAVGAVYYLLMMFTSVPVDSPLPGPAGIAQIILVLVLMPLTYFTISHALWKQAQIYESSRMMELQRREYGAIRQTIQLNRVYRHDMRHHLIALEGMLQQGNTEEATEYVQELRGKLAELIQTVWCANSAINAVIAAYIHQAEECGCRVEAEVAIPGELPYEEMDLCVILANTLENATHACEEQEEKWIKLDLSMTRNRRIVYRIENPCQKEVVFGQNGFPVVSQQEHGLGLRSVKALAEKYNGLFRCRWEEGVFTVQVALFPPAET